MLYIYKNFIVNAVPTAKVQHRMQADQYFLKCYIRAHRVHVWGGGSWKLWDIFSTTPLYLHTERVSLGKEEGIRQLYFDGKNWKNNKIMVVKTSFQKALFEEYIPFIYNWYLIE